MTGIRRRRCKQLPGALKETTGYWILKEEVLARIVWRTCFVASGNGPVARQTME